MALASMDKKSSAKAVETRWHRVKRERGERQKIENLSKRDATDFTTCQM